MSKWISVKDFTPDGFGWFLVCDDYIASKVTIGFYEGDDSGHWLPIDNRDDSDSMVITHWMPLPDAPEVEV